MNILAIAYRGYTKSTGSPSEQGLYLDAQAVTDYVANCDKINKNKVFVMGRSLGGAVAIDLIRNLDTKDIKHVYKGVIIESTFSSIDDMADILLPFLKRFKMIKKFLLKIHMDSASKVSSIKTPIMFITGSSDNFVPTHMTERLHKDCTSKCKVIHIVP